MRIRLIGFASRRPPTKQLTLLSPVFKNFPSNVLLYCFNEIQLKPPNFSESIFDSMQQFLHIIYIRVIFVLFVERCPIIRLFFLEHLQKFVIKVW
jgi:hypothetical protein